MECARFHLKIGCFSLEERAHELLTYRLAEVSAVSIRNFRVREPQIPGISDSTLPKSNPFRQYVVDLDRNSLSRLDDLPFAFENGRCANINNEYGLLCSPLDGFKNCWIFDGLYNKTYRWSVLIIGKEQ